MVELIGAVNAQGRWCIVPFFYSRVTKGRRWSVPNFESRHYFIEDLSKDEYRSVVSKAISEASLIILGSLWQQSNLIPLSIAANLGKPIVLWAERPGVRFNGLLMRLLRDTLIRHQFRNLIGVWGIGSWATVDYKRILSRARFHRNMPYASNLDRFFQARGTLTAHSSESGLRFLYSGEISIRKGVDLLIRAFLRIVASGVDVTLTLIGSGPLEHELRRLVPVEQANRIQFLGFVNWEQLPTVYSAHDILVAPSRYDGWGLIIMEGLAAGMPVIATNRMGAALDYVLDGENGWLIQADDEDALESAIRKATIAPVTQMGKLAQESAATWTLDKAARQWCDLADEAAQISANRGKQPS